jgi:hypothetical protein
MSLSPAQRHSQRVTMQQQQARLEEVNTTASLHLQMQEIMEDVAVLRSLGTTAERVEMKRDVLLTPPTLVSCLPLATRQTLHRRALTLKRAGISMKKRAFQ